MRVCWQASRQPLGLGDCVEHDGACMGQFGGQRVVQCPAFSPAQTNLSDLAVNFFSLLVYVCHQTPTYTHADIHYDIKCTDLQLIQSRWRMCDPNEKK